MPRPAGLRPQVQFWIRVYTRIDTNSGFLHDADDLSVIYDTLHFAPGSSRHQREKQVERARRHYAAALRHIARSHGKLSPQDERIRALWGDKATPARLRRAARNIRFQLGQSDRFRAGLVRAGAWESYIAQALVDAGLPIQLAALPLVESSFNPDARSKAGAAGLWQFMRSTGRRFMRIDAVVDDRMDPFRSTEAAAQLLAYNYHVLGTWPLAITAYNCGVACVRRAKERLGTTDIVRIIHHYHSRSFGFAARNFYASFLAALTIDSDPHKYFGPLQPDPETKFQEVALPAVVPVKALEQALHVGDDALRALNPALRAPVWHGRLYVPKGYRLRLPRDGRHWTTTMLAARLTPDEMFASQPGPAKHRIRRGDTLWGLARRYGVSVRTLARLNGISTRTRLRIGHDLLVPIKRLPARVQLARSQPSAPAAGSAGSLPAVYVVRRGDSLSRIAARTGLPEAQLLKINHLSDPDHLRAGQHLRLALAQVAASGTPDTSSGGGSQEGGSQEADGATQPAAAPPAQDGAASPAQDTAASSTQDGAVSPAQAEQESAEDAAAATAAQSSADAQPVSEAQAESVSPAVGPATDASASPDPFDYSVADDGTIVVAANETLGHYAEWLDIATSRLRRINHMRYGRPVLIGHRIKLDFHKVSRQRFEQQRRKYHRTLQAAFFAAHRIVGTKVYVARSGDSMWTLTRHYDDVPLWLLRQYNPDLDPDDFRPGMQIVIPRVQDVAGSDEDGGTGT